MYRILAYFSSYFTDVTAIIGIVKNFEEMEYVMQSGLPRLAMFKVVWTQFFTRYQPVSLPIVFHK
jgi:hypothetical protein